MLFSPCKENLPVSPLFPLSIVHSMPTRSGPLHHKNSMAVVTRKRTSAISPRCHGKQKRKQQPEHETRISVNFSLVENYKRPKLTYNGAEGEMAIEQERMEKRTRREIEYGSDRMRKRSRNKNQNGCEMDFFDELPDDLVLDIMCKLSASAESPSHLINARLTCKRLNELGQHSWVLARASTRSVSVRAKRWSESAHHFLKMCADAGNLEACYILGMIHFYCLGNRKSGVAYMAQAAMGSHPSAIYSLAIIQFNGSGGSRSDKNLRAGVTFCARAAHLGHVDALRELGHCLQDGYGVRHNVAQGRHLLVRANARELASYLSHCGHVPVLKAVSTCCIPMLSDFGFSLPVNQHPANRFLVDWFESRAGKGEARDEKEEMRTCSHVACGRVETRRHEFRRCSVCGKANYCSRACQAMDWKRRHRLECVPADAAAPPVGDDAPIIGLV